MCLTDHFDTTRYELDLMNVDVCSNVFGFSGEAGRRCVCPQHMCMFVTGHYDTIRYEFDLMNVADVCSDAFGCNGRKMMGAPNICVYVCVPY